MHKSAEPTIPLSEILLPSSGNILIMPCLVPHGDTGKTYSRNVVFFGTQAEFHIVIFNENWHGKTNFLQDFRGNEA